LHAISVHKTPLATKEVGLSNNKELSLCTHMYAEIMPPTIWFLIVLGYVLGYYGNEEFKVQTLSGFVTTKVASSF